jgi:Tfp pilus assembly PilM family ATPase
MSHIVGIEIDDQMLKIIQGESEGQKFSISKFLSLHFSSPAEESVRIVSAIKSLNLDTKRVIFFIPRNKFSVHYVSFPTKDPKELNEMAKFRSKRQLLYSKEEITHAYRIIGLDPKGATRIMLVVVRQDVVNNYLKPLMASRLSAFIITMNSLGLANWYGWHFAQANKDICLVDLDKRATNIGILKAGKLVFSREVNKGLEIFENSAERVSEIVMEIQHSLSAYDKEEIGPAMKEILVTGATRGIEILANSLRQTMDIEARCISPFEGVDFKEEVRQEILNQAEDISLAKILGCLAREERFDVNLVPPETEKKKTTVYLLQTKYATALLWLWFLVCLGAIVGWELYRLNSYASKLKAQLKIINKRIETLENKQRVVNLILGHLNRQGPFLEVLREIAISIPDGVLLRRLDYNRQKKNVVLDGTSSSSEAITRLMQTLQDSTAFKMANQKYVRSGGKEGNVFQIEVQLK